jgi:hypothetical protein
MYGILLTVVSSSPLLPQLCSLRFLMLIGLVVWMIGDQRGDMLSFMEGIWSPGVLENSLQFQGQVRRLNIRLLLILQQSLSGFSRYYRSLVFHKLDLQCYSVIILERLTCLQTQFFMQGWSILRWIFTSFVNVWIRSNFRFDSFLRRIKLHIFSPNHSLCRCMSIVNAISIFYQLRLREGVRI